MVRELLQIWRISQCYVIAYLNIHCPWGGKTISEIRFYIFRVFPSLISLNLDFCLTFAILYYTLRQGLKELSNLFFFSWSIRNSVELLPLWPNPFKQVLEELIGSYFRYSYLTYKRKSSVRLYFLSSKHSLGSNDI